MYVTLLAPRKPERGSRSGPPLLTWEKTDMRRFATLRNAACALAGAAMLTLAGCGSEAPPPPPPPEVGNVTIRAQPVTNVITPPGPQQAGRTAEERGRATSGESVSQCASVSVVVVTLQTKKTNISIKKKNIK